MSHSRAASLAHPTHRSITRSRLFRRRSNAFPLPLRKRENHGTKPRRRRWRIALSCGVKRMIACRARRVAISELARKFIAAAATRRLAAHDRCRSRLLPAICQTPRRHGDLSAYGVTLAAILGVFKLSEHIAVKSITAPLTRAELFWLRVFVLLLSAKLILAVFENQ